MKSFFIPFYPLTAKLEASGFAGGFDIKQMKALEKENAELKKMLADSMLEIDALKAVNEKKW